MYCSRINPIGTYQAPTVCQAVLGIREAAETHTPQMKPLAFTLAMNKIEFVMRAEAKQVYQDHVPMCIEKRLKGKPSK